MAHSALDEAIDYLKDVRQRPVWLRVPEDIKSKLHEPLPVAPQGIEKTYRDFRELVLPYPTGNIHPRFWGWVHGTGLATGIISEMLGAAMNANCGGRDHGALYVERQRNRLVPRDHWLSRAIQRHGGEWNVDGQRDRPGSGAEHARRLRCARRRHWLCPKSLITYASSEAHSSVAKALELLGLGHDSLRKIPVDEKFAIDPVALRHAIQEDRRAGREPFCVVGCAGTVNTGAMDNLTILAEICQVGGTLVSCRCRVRRMVRPEPPCLVRWFEASSVLIPIAFDFHKWMYVQYDAGCVLVRDGELHKKAFATRPDYLQHSDRGLAGGGEWFTDLGPELSRSFRALKIWFALKEHGTRRFGEMIEKNCRQARYLAQLVEANPSLELLVHPTLNIVCFRYRTAEVEAEELDRLNRDIVADLQERGIAAPSTTRINGKLAIRVAITNHRSRREDFDLLVKSVIAVADERIRSHTL